MASVFNYLDYVASLAIKYGPDAAAAWEALKDIFVKASSPALTEGKDLHVQASVAAGKFPSFEVFKTSFQAAIRTPHPLAYVALRMHARGMLRGQGKGIIETNVALFKTPNSKIDSLALATPSATDPAYPIFARIGTGNLSSDVVQSEDAKAAALGGGGFITFLETLATDFENFLATPQGQALEGAFFTMLMSLIAGA